MSIEACIFQVRDAMRINRGACFAISPSLVVTCAHIVKDCGGKVGGLLSLFFDPENLELRAEVLSKGWNEEEDVAFLRLQSSLPNNAIHMGEKLGSFGSQTEINRKFFSFEYSYIPLLNVGNSFIHGLIIGQIQNDHGSVRLQLGSQEFSFGVNGIPVVDYESGLVVGMIQKTRISDQTGKFRHLADALPTEILCRFSPDELTIKNVIEERSLNACVFQIKDSQGIVRGTGFAISPDLVVTCDHVVKDCKAKIGDLLNVFFYPEKIDLKAKVLSDGWNDKEDLAFLRLKESLPYNAIHMGKRLGSFGPQTEIKRDFRAFGYPNIKSDVKGFWAQGIIKGQIQNDHGSIRLQLGSQDISYGMSGAPVMDIKSGMIVGMVQKTQVPDQIGKFRDLAYAIPTEILCKYSPDELTIKRDFLSKLK